MVRFLLIGHVQICFVPFVGTLLMLPNLFEREEEKKRDYCWEDVIYLLLFCYTPINMVAAGWLIGTPPTRFVKSEISWQRAGHGMIQGQRWGASVWPGWPVAPLSVIVCVQQVRGGLEDGRPWGLAKGRSCGAHRRTGQAPRAQAHAGRGVTPRAARCPFGTILALQVAVRFNPRKWRVSVPLALGRRRQAGGEGWNIFSTGDNGVRETVSCWAWREWLRAGITACPLWAVGLRTLSGNWRAGLKGGKKRLITHKCISVGQMLSYFSHIYIYNKNIDTDVDSESILTHIVELYETYYWWNLCQIILMF